MNKFEKEFLFSGLKPCKHSNKYDCCVRVSEDENKIVVRIAKAQVFPTQFGYGLIVGHDKVVWLKKWQVIENWFTGSGVDVVLDKQFYIVKNSSKAFDDISVGDCASDSEFEKENGYHSWEDMLNTAKAQMKNIGEVKF